MTVNKERIDGMNELLKAKRDTTNRGKHSITPEERTFLKKVVHSVSDIDLINDRADFFGSKDPNVALSASEEEKVRFVRFHAQQNELRRGGNPPSSIE